MGVGVLGVAKPDEKPSRVWKVDFGKSLVYVCCGLYSVFAICMHKHRVLQRAQTAQIAVFVCGGVQQKTL